VGEAEPLEGHEGPQAGYEVEEPWYEGVTQDVSQGSGHFSLLLTQLLNSENITVYLNLYNEVNKKMWTLLNIL
jgi:hypothetical protein